MNAAALALLLLMAAPATPPATPEPYTLEIIDEGERYDFPLVDRAACLETLAAAHAENPDLEDAACLPGIVQDQDDMEADQD